MIKVPIRCSRCDYWEFDEEAFRAKYDEENRRWEFRCPACRLEWWIGVDLGVELV